MADRAILADDQRGAQIGVQGRAFLDVGARSDRNALVVAAQGRAKPDPDILAKRDVADDARIGATQ